MDGLDFFAEAAPRLSGPEHESRIDAAIARGRVDTEMGCVGDFKDPDGEYRALIVPASDGGLRILNAAKTDDGREHGEGARLVGRLPFETWFCDAVAGEIARLRRSPGEKFIPSDRLAMGEEGPDLDSLERLRPSAALPGLLGGEAHRPIASSDCAPGADALPVFLPVISLVRR